MIVLFLPALMKITHQNYLVSISRYVLPLWPGFMMLAIFGENKLFNRFWFTISSLLLLIASALFFISFWVA